MAKKTKKEPKAARPKQARLPGTEDAVITEIEDLAESYAEARDERIKLLAEEVKIKDQLMAIMKKLKRTVYTRDGISVSIVTESEKLKVKIKKEKDGDDGTAVELS